MRNISRFLTMILSLVFVFSLMLSPMALASEIPEDSGRSDTLMNGVYEETTIGTETGDGDSASSTLPGASDPSGDAGSANPGNPAADDNSAGSEPGSSVNGDGSSSGEPGGSTPEDGQSESPEQAENESPIEKPAIVFGVQNAPSQAPLLGATPGGDYTISGHSTNVYKNQAFLNGNRDIYAYGSRIPALTGLPNYSLKQDATGNVFDVYCIEPGKMYSEQGYNQEDRESSWPWTGLGASEKSLLAKALFWGYPNNTGGYANVDEKAATQAMVWDILTGFVSESGGQIVRNPRVLSGTDFAFQGFSDTNICYNAGSGVDLAYNALLQRMNSSTGTVGIPSFANAGSSSASNICTLEYNRATGLFEGSFTDSNAYAINYNFQYSSGGLTVTQNGNSVTITITKAFAKANNLNISAFSLPVVTSSTANASISQNNIQLFKGAPGTKPVNQLQTLVRYAGGSSGGSYPTAYLAVKVNQIFDPFIIQLSKLTEDGNTNGPSRAGAQYTIKCYDGLYTSANLPAAPDYTWIYQTDANGSVYFDDPSYFVSGDALIIEAGRAMVPDDSTLTVQETQAPAGYNLDGSASVGSISAPVSEPLLFQVSGEVFTVIRDSNSLTADSITVYEKITRGGLKIAKHLADHTGTDVAYAIGSAPLGPITLTLTNKNSYPIKLNDGTEIAVNGTWDVTTDANGAFESPTNYLPYGSYSIAEKTVPDGVIRDTDSYNFSITTEGAYYTHTAINQVMEGSVTLTKKDVVTGTSVPQGDATLEGAVFTVKNVSGHPVLYNGTVIEHNGTVCTMTTNAEGVATVTNLIIGVYEISETQPPQGYTLSDTVYTVTITP